MEILVAYADYQLYSLRNVLYLGVLAGALMRLPAVEADRTADARRGPRDATVGRRGVIELLEVALAVIALGLLVPAAMLLLECTASLLPARPARLSQGGRPSVVVVVPAHDEAEPHRRLPRPRWGGKLAATIEWSSSPTTVSTTPPRARRSTEPPSSNAPMTATRARGTRSSTRWMRSRPHRPT